MDKFSLHCLNLNFTVDSCMLILKTSNITYSYHNNDHHQHLGYTTPLHTFSSWYSDIHGYVAIVICIFGIMTNICNVVVLRDKKLVSSTNCLLTALAVSDGLTMLVYLPYAVLFYCLHGNTPSTQRNTLVNMCYVLFYACFSVFVHTISILLTVTLAVFRYIMVKHSDHARTWCSLHRAKLSVFIAVLLSLALSLTNIFGLTVVQGTAVVGNDSHVWNITGWFVRYKTGPVKVVNFWIVAVCVRLLPCVILTVISTVLIHTMRSVDLRQAILLRRKPMSLRKQVLLAIMLLFLISEFPHGVLNLLSGLFDVVFDNVYEPLGDVLDIVALLNSSINFILYCTMSTKFRRTFVMTFIQPIVKTVMRVCRVLEYYSLYTYIEPLEASM